MGNKGEWETVKKSSRGKKKVVKIAANDNDVSSAKAKSSLMVRNLPKRDLGGVIFGCKHNTVEECYREKLFGLPYPHYSYVRNIEPELPLFLFNYGDRTLHGVFEAASIGQLYINRYGWMEDATDYVTPYPAQAKFKVRKLYQPLTEELFQPVIAKNYYATRLFWFELDHNQTEQLIFLFSLFPITPAITLPKHIQTLNALLEGSGGNHALKRKEGIGTSNRHLAVLESGPSLNCQDHSLKAQQKVDVIGVLDAENEQENVRVDSSSGRTYSSVVKDAALPVVRCDQSDLKSISCTFHVDKEPSTYGHQLSADGKRSVDPSFPEQSRPSEAKIGDIATEKHNKEPLSQHLFLTQSNSATVTGMGNSITQAPQSSVKNTVASNMVEESESLSMLLVEENSNDWNLVQKDWESQVFHEDYVKSKNGSAEFRETVLPPFRWSTSSCSEFESEALELPKDEDVPISCEYAYDCLREETVSGPETTHLYPLVLKLRQEIEELKICKMEHHQKIHSLEQELVVARIEIQKLKNEGKMLECNSGPSFRQPKAEERATSNCQSIFIAGGFDGFSWLSEVDSYSPYVDTRSSLPPMRSARSNYAAASLNGEIYIIGGTIENMWYDTVESYNPVTGRWTYHSALTKKKGSSAGVSLNEKIFILGGGDGIECFSEVEIFDLHAGRWIPSKSMLQKRFVPAAAEINGVLYVVGGYDGKKYLRSFERYDPRECSWTELKSMKTTRGCHALAVLNEKLYAFGGYGGESMVSSVEVFDPRMSSWVMGEPMNVSRGYFGTAVVGESIYAIGGLKGGDVLDTVEIYREGHGWQMTNLKGIGKRCFFSAVVL